MINRIADFRPKPAKPTITCIIFFILSNSFDTLCSLPPNSILEATAHLCAHGTTTSGSHWACHWSHTRPACIWTLANNAGGSASNLGSWAEHCIWTISYAWGGQVVGWSLYFFLTLAESITNLFESWKSMHWEVHHLRELVFRLFIFMQIYKNISIIDNLIWWYPFKKHAFVDYWHTSKKLHLLLLFGSRSPRRLVSIFKKFSLIIRHI